MEEGTESMNDQDDLICGFYYARSCPGRFQFSVLHEMFPESFPEGKMPARRQGESEGKDINPGEEQGPF